VLVKVGFAGIVSAGRVGELIAAAVRGAKAGSDGNGGVVAVARRGPRRESRARGALAGSRASRRPGVLLDTADKNGPGLPGLVAPGALAARVAEAHEPAARRARRQNTRRSPCGAPVPISWGEARGRWSRLAIGYKLACQALCARESAAPPQAVAGLGARFRLKR
jgi:hypothetical protein